MIAFLDHSAAGPAPAQRLHLSDTPRARLAREAAAHDAGLVLRFNDGDETAFLDLMARHRERILALTTRLLHCHADAEEVTQDTFLRAHRALRSFRGDASVATWLHRIALNLARNRYWYFFRRGRDATVSLNGPWGADGTSCFADLVSAEAPSPARELITAEFSDCIAACMQRIDASAREILHLKNTLHRSYAEIAGDLGIKVGTVKSRLARARDSLRAQMNLQCPDFGPLARPAAWLDQTRAPTGLVAREA